MKKTILTLVMAMLCLFLRVNAQRPTVRTPNPSVIKPVKIGQRIPEVNLDKLHNYKTAKMNLADFEAKLIIIDFWATWCSPCVAMIPRMDSLQKEFKHDVQFISVSYQSEKEVTTFMEKLEEQNRVKYTIPYSTDDNLLRFMFPHKTLPHYVWISANGTVRAITALKEITSANIDKMLISESFTLPEKTDIVKPFDFSTPLLVNGNGGDGSKLIYHNLLSSYEAGLPANMHFERADGIHINSITITNSPILWLYKNAYGNGFTTFFPQNRVLLEVADPTQLNSTTSGKEYLDWLSKPGHGICYELRLPPELAHKLYASFQQNLEMLYPQYTAREEKRNVKCMALVLLPGGDKIATRDPKSKVIENFDRFGFHLQNSTLLSFVSRTQMQFEQSSTYPFVDATGYKGKIDMKVLANLSSIEEINKSLRPYNLEWQERSLPQDMLVIGDTNKINQTTE